MSYIWSKTDLLIGVRELFWESKEWKAHKRLRIAGLWHRLE